MKKVFSALKRSFSLSGSPEPDIRFSVDKPPAPPRKALPDDLPPLPPPPTARLAVADDNVPEIEPKAVVEPEVEAEIAKPEDADLPEIEYGAVVKPEAEPSIEEIAEKTAREIKNAALNLAPAPKEIQGEPEEEVVNKHESDTRKEDESLRADAAEKAQAMGQVIAAQPEAFAAKESASEDSSRAARRKDELARIIEKKAEHLGSVQGYKAMTPNERRVLSSAINDQLLDLRREFEKLGGDYGDATSGNYKPEHEPEQTSEQAEHRTELGNKILKKIDEIEALEGGVLRQPSSPERDKAVRRRDELEEDLSRLKKWYQEDGADFDELYASRKASSGPAAGSEVPSADVRTEEEIAFNVNEALAGTAQADHPVKQPSAPEQPVPPQGPVTGEYQKMGDEKYKVVGHDEKGNPITKTKPEETEKEETSWGPGHPDFDRAVKDFKELGIENEMTRRADGKKEKSDSGGDKFQAVAVEDIVGEMRKQGKPLEAEQYLVDREIAKEERELARAGSNKLMSEPTKERIVELKAKRERLPGEVGRARRAERRESRKQILRERIRKLGDEYRSGKADADLQANVEQRRRAEEELATIERLAQADREPESRRQRAERRVTRSEEVTEIRSGRPAAQPAQERPQPVSRPETSRRPYDEFEGSSSARLEKILKKHERQTEELHRLRNYHDRYMKRKMQAVLKWEDQAERYKDTFIRGRFYSWLAGQLEHDVEYARNKFRGADELYRQGVENRNRVIRTLENRLREQITEPERIAERVRTNLEAVQTLAQEELGALLTLENQLTNLEEAANDPGRRDEVMDSAWRQKVEDIRSEVLERRSRLRETEARVFELRSRYTREQGRIDRIKEQIAAYVRRSRLPEEVDFETQPLAPEPTVEAPSEPTGVPEHQSSSPSSLEPPPVPEDTESASGSEYEPDLDEEDEDNDAYEVEMQPRFDVAGFIEFNNDRIRKADDDGGPELTEEQFRGALAGYLKQEGREIELENATADDLFAVLKNLYEQNGKKKDDAFWQERRDELADVLEPTT